MLLADDLLVAGAQRLGLPLTPSQREQFRLYQEELMDWNRRVNLTAISSPEGIQTKHFLDSLSCLVAFPGFGGDPGQGLLPGKALKAIDVGTGAGFPGLPLRIIWPSLRLTLLEATGKKVAFLRHLIRRLGLADVELLEGRAEEWAHDPGQREQYQVVLARAVACLPTLVEYCLPFAQIGGRMIAQKKGAVAEEVADAQPAIGKLGGRLAGVLPVDLDGLRDRSLVIVEKVAPTPVHYPRRPGLPGKRPLSI